jgi:branched-chain amino acid transport system permease protein
MIARMLRGVPRRALILLGLFVVALVLAPLVSDGYVLTVLTTVLYLAFLGQAWNVMMGFAGQLSLGHALYVGLGAYAGAALYVHFGIGPWLGIPLAVVIGVLAGSIIGLLGFRFAIAGVYFALLTIAFAEFTRILFDHFTWVGSTGGFFLPVANRTENDLLNLRGTPTMFYYVILVLMLAALVLCRALLTSRLGYYWRAVREDPEAAQALGVNIFRYKMYAVMLSSGLTAIGGVFYAFYYNNLFPETVFSIERSIELILAPIIGGVGTLFGPILGAFVLTPLAEVLTALTDHLGIDGIKQFVYGLCVVLIVLFRRDGLWPWISRRLGLDRVGER